MLEASATDWVAVGAMTGIVALVVGVVTTLMNHRLDRNRRWEDARERVRFRRMDRKERQWLLDQQLESAKRERLAKHYGTWFQLLTACVMHTHDAFLATKRSETTANERAEALARIRRDIPSDDPDVLRLKAQVAKEQADLMDTACIARSQLVQRLTEIGGVSAMIHIDDFPNYLADLDAVTAAMSSWDGERLEEGQSILERGTKLVNDRIAALRVARGAPPSTA